MLCCLKGLSKLYCLKNFQITLKEKILKKEKFWRNEEQVKSS